MKSKLKLESLETRDVPSTTCPEIPGAPGGSTPAIAPQEPVIIEPDIKIILPGDKKQ